MPPIAKDHKSIVLIVDDSAETISMLSAALNMENYTVLIALDGEQALNISEKITPDMVLMDVNMPVLNGFETCRRLKNNPRLLHTPVIFMTGKDDIESISEGFTSGGVDYINKPININELLIRMRAHLTKAQLTISAHNALDRAKQYLFIVNNQGQIKWITPQAKHFLDLAGTTTTWLKDKLPEKIKAFFKNNAYQEFRIQITRFSQPIEIRYVEAMSDDEHLIRLVNLAEEGYSAILKKHFALTDRESEILLWISKGKTNREIAIILEMSHRTVNKHLEQVFKKLDVDNRTSAAIVALKHLQN